MKKVNFYKKKITKKLLVALAMSLLLPLGSSAQVFSNPGSPIGGGVYATESPIFGSSYQSAYGY